MFPKRKKKVRGWMIVDENGKSLDLSIFVFNSREEARYEKQKYGLLLQKIVPIEIIYEA